MRAPTLALITAALLSAPTAAQVIIPDTWVLAASRDFIGANAGQGGGLWTLSPDLTRFRPIDLTGTGTLAASLVWANAVAIDRTRRVFVGTLQTTSPHGDPNGSNIYVFQVVADRAVSAAKVTTATPGGSFSQICIRHDKLWFVTDGGGSRAIIGWVPLNGPFPATPTVVYTVTSDFGGLGQSITTNGRELFIGSSYNANDTANIWSLDPDAATPKLTKVARAFGTQTQWPSHLGFTAAGKLYAFGTSGSISEIDPVTGQETIVNTTAAPQGINGAAVNPWRGQVAVVPGYSASTQRDVNVYNTATNSWSGSVGTVGVPGFGTAAAVAALPPVFETGVGCPGKNAKEPRIGSENKPSIPSPTFAITLRDADATSPALFVLGSSDKTWGAIPLPLSLAGAGAPGCWLNVAPVLFVGMATSTSGTARLPLAIPNDTGLNGLAIYGQWIVVTAVNKLGLVTTGGAEINIR